MDYAVIGKSLPHTLSPELHRSFGLDYGVVELESEKALLTFFTETKLKGFNVTIPYKQAVIPYLTRLSKNASEIGAVNTVVREADGFVGYNTDIDGMAYALLLADITLDGRKIAVLGSGGAAKTAVYLSQKSGGFPFIVSRTGEINYTNVYEQDIDVIINATPLGTFPHSEESPLDLSRFSSLKGVMDLVYNPLRTRFVEQANSLGIPVASGLAMLVEQARLARDLFVGEKSDVNISELTLRQLRRNMENIVLIGMPGSGKSTVGRALADLMSRSFIDTDEEIEKRERKSIAEIFKAVGERGFREIESEVIKEASQKTGCVIATGGGAILSERNRLNLLSNGIPVYLKRRLCDLATKGRPLSTDMQRVQNIFEQRSAIYESFAVIEVTNDAAIDLVAKKILKELDL